MLYPYRNSILLISLLTLGPACSRNDGGPLSTSQQRFVDANVVAVADWSVLDTAVANKRIVSLGEFTHGAKEIAYVRNEIIRHLHTAHGFDVLLLEVGIGEQILPDRNRADLTPDQMMDGFFGAWRTPGMSGMMSYIKEFDLDFAGYDVQRTGESFATLLKETGYSDDLESRFGELQTRLRARGADTEPLREPVTALAAEYRRLADTASSSHHYVSRVAVNRAAFLEYMLQWKIDGDWNRRWAARDSMMAANVAWLAEERYAGRKLIVVGHNFHVARDNVNEEVMGEYLSPTYGDDMSVLGFFAGAGSYANNAGETEMMDAPDSTQLDLKHVIARAVDANAEQGRAAASAQRVFFLGTQGLDANTPGAEWLFEDIVVNDTFIDLSSTNQLKLGNHFDGIVLLPAVTPATH